MFPLYESSQGLIAEKLFHHQFPFANGHRHFAINEIIIERYFGRILPRVTVENGAQTRQYMAERHIGQGSQLV